MPDVFDQSKVQASETAETTRIFHKHRVANRVPRVASESEPPVTAAGGTTPLFNSQAEADRPTTLIPSRHVDEYSATMANEIPSTNHLAAFVPKPLALRFSTQAPSEYIILLLRQHPATQVAWFLVALVGAFLPLLFDSTHFFNFLPFRYQLGVYLGWYMILIGYIFESFIKWFYNVYLITDERIIDVDFFHLTYRNISAAKIDNIEDVTANTAGFLSAMFDFGTVTIQTAATQREFEFSGVPHPVKVGKIINDLILEEEREKVEGRVN